MKFFIQLLLVILICIVCMSCQSKNGKPNVLLITLDTVRADALGCYGNSTVKTPVIDKMAEEGALFEDAVCQIPATLASHAAIMTGCNPNTTGVRFGKAHIPDSVKTLAKEFTKARYETAAFISSQVLAPVYGLNQGFSRYDMGNLGEQVFERRADATMDSAIAYLQQIHKKPLFTWIHLYDAHSPYNAPAPYTTQYDPEYQGTIKGSIQDITRLQSSHGETASALDLLHLRALYWGEVSYMDYQLGRLADVLRKQNVLDKTIIVIMADHGENLGEKQHFFHGNDLYWPSMHIPLIIRFPAVILPKTRLAELVQSIDVYPTLLELCGIQDKYRIDGQSLLPALIKQQDGQRVDPLPAFMETEADPLCEADKLHGVRTKEYLYIFNQAHRQGEIPVGMMTEIPLRGPTIVMMRIKGDPAVRLMAHIRYRTRELYTSRDNTALAKLNTTILHAESFGTDPLHQQAAKQSSYLPPARGWRLQATPDLYHWAQSYGTANGWPTQWMVLEGVGVDASLPATQQQGAFAVDQIELFAPQLRFPNSPRFRNPFWIIADFENGKKEELVDSSAGPAHTITSKWLNEPVHGGTRQQEITITIKDATGSVVIDELYAISSDRNEEKNLIRENQPAADELRGLLQEQIKSSSRNNEVIEISPGQRKALESLGYIR